ncbi:hypothetical protein DDB_G0293412 [Dictyostelium discoideum AX4]|uniref:Uncharacterized protein n=1 Tax=Dictyostelium discoideum TaxID=44689 RepID=Q54BV0_DICDI|nr:hypothetical protein DDB_G0293412 [Dictyostelium discoideum AX4]EAL60740.1 hypothetical protein DDB_G0293412 [Dictyostelium discoideum AX4]|eukprot:XP_629151.1 hypothetical protein DDB_G0293412 [Dictyostelium discoideum AX4]
MDSFFIKPGTAHTLSSNRAGAKNVVDTRINSRPSSNRGGRGGGMSSSRGGGGRGGRGGFMSSSRGGGRGGSMSSSRGGGRGGAMSSSRGGGKFRERESATNDTTNKYRDSKNNYKRKLSTEKDDYYDSDDNQDDEDNEKPSDEESDDNNNNIKNNFKNNIAVKKNINKYKNIDSDDQSDDDDDDDNNNGEIEEFHSGDEDRFNSENDSEEDKSSIKKRLKLSVVQEDETTDERRLRLANEYLEKIRKTKQDLDLNDAVKDDLDKSSGRYQYSYRQQVSNIKFIENSSNITILKGHSSPITCIVLSDDQSIAYSASRDIIIKWDLINKIKLNKIKGFIPSKKNRIELESLGKDGKEELKKKSYQGKILSMALSFDGKYLVTGGEEKLIKVWDTESMQVVETFKGHKDVISALTFRKGTYTLYSGSNDRTIKIWDLSQMAFVDTRYGHQSPITAMDSLSRERCISVSTDKTVRVWKIPEESQLIFRGHTHSVDCCVLVAEDKFLTGSQEGSIALWNVNKKNATFIKNNAHPVNSGGNSGTDSFSWISSVSAIPNSDMAASGSCDGSIRLWSIMGGDKLKEINQIPAIGFVNDLKFAHDCSFLLAAVSKEHKFGRWKKIGSAKNSLLLINLKEQVNPNDLLQQEEQVEIELNNNIENQDEDEEDEEEEEEEN